MLDIMSLLRALPVSRLEPCVLAQVRGLTTGAAPGEFGPPCLELLEPPARHRHPFVEPQRMLEIVLRHQGLAPAAARQHAPSQWALLAPQLAPGTRAVFLDPLDPLDGQLPECVAASQLLAHLRGQPWVDADVIDFLERAVDAATHAPMFHGPDHTGLPWALSEHPALPPPQAMIEFMPGPPWQEHPAPDDPWAVLFPGWREQMRGIAAQLEAALGEPVYHFAATEAEDDDDQVHRLLALHWCCTAWPRSRYVEYLVQASGARDVDELKAALIEPHNYVQPFKMNDAWIGIEALPLQIDYLPRNAHKVAGLVLRTPQAVPCAQRLLLQGIRTSPYVVAPPELLDQPWVKTAARHCQPDRMLESLRPVELPEPIRLLAALDELNVVADAHPASARAQLQLSEQVEDLLWMALQFELPVRYFSVDGYCFSNARDLRGRLQATGAPQRVQALQEQYAAARRSLREVRMDNDYGSSGLWDERGRMLRYEDLAVPFALVRRLLAWQGDFDLTVMPPDRSTPQWWRRHLARQIDLAGQLQQALGPSVRVKIWRDARWRPIAEAQAPPEEM